MHTDNHALSRIRTHDPAFERAKTIHALYRAATVIGLKTVCLGECFPQREEATGKVKKHNREELHSVYYSWNITKVNK
jgi:hypothetical protein